MNRGGGGVIGERRRQVREKQSTVGFGKAAPKGMGLRGHATLRNGVIRCQYEKGGNFAWWREGKIGA